MKLEFTNCPCCSSSDSEVAATARPHCEQISGTFTIVTCKRCGLSYLNPRPDDELLARYYEILNQHPVRPHYEPTASESGSAIRRFWRRLQHQNPAVSLIDRGPVLDVGCNNGELLTEIAALGHGAHGIEFNAEAVDRCRQKGLQVTLGDVRRIELPQGFYRYVVASHVIEHLPDPVGILRRFRKALAPGGRIIICVPYRRSPMARLFGNSWHGWDPPFHLLHFDKAAMKEVCHRAGLRVVRLLTLASSDDLARSLWVSTGKRRRHLLLRITAWPLFALSGRVGQGSGLLVVAEDAEAERLETSRSAEAR